jgi:hypothetical protein
MWQPWIQSYDGELKRKRCKKNYHAKSNLMHYFKISTSFALKTGCDATGFDRVERKSNLEARSHFLKASFGLHQK